MTRTRTLRTTGHSSSSYKANRLPEMERLSVDGVCFENTDTATALAAVHALVEDAIGGTPRVVFFVNVHTLHVARKSRELRESLDRADVLLPDGSGIAFAGRFHGNPVRENLNGTDFIPRVLADAERSARSVYLLGARPEVIQAGRRRLEVLYPGLRICGSRHGHFLEGEEKEIVEEIAHARPDILLVGMGTPFQEVWITRNLHRFHAGTCFGVGGLFDFLSGEKPRASVWIRRMGLEWVFRFVHEPLAKWERVLFEIPLFALRTITGRVSVHKALPRARNGA